LAYNLTDTIAFMIYCLSDIYNEILLLLHVNCGHWSLIVCCRKAIIRPERQRHYCPVVSRQRVCIEDQIVKPNVC